ncbi:MAG: hypothetical protein ACUVQ6_08830 [Dissulfurimicrobium sp.]|uniref:hypothetical protein n=1 Tax=Dissulfurimicrobium sp. TaxID=2022436 RepID=UPI00404B230C
MRCPRCGIIDFDYLETCKKCGAGLGDVSKSLGLYVMANKSLNWFDLANNVKLTSAAMKGEGMYKTDRPINISEIDVSDLVEESGQFGDEVFEIDSNTLKKVADNEEFQRALNDLLKGK